MASDVGENSIISRAGGAPTLAVGMAFILHNVIGGPAMMSFWYHFAILFEALFILTAVDAGTRAGRFMLQDLMGTFVPGLRRTESLVANLIATSLCVAAWGYFLYQGVVDPSGWYQYLVAVVWNCQPDAGGGGLGTGDGGALQDEERPLCVGHGGTNDLVADLHAVCRLPENVPPRSQRSAFWPTPRSIKKAWRNKPSWHRPSPWSRCSR